MVDMWANGGTTRRMASARFIITLVVCMKGTSKTTNDMVIYDDDYDSDGNDDG